MDFVFSSDQKTLVDIANVSFVVFAAMTLIGGVLAVGARLIIHAVLGLILALAGVAGLYLFLGNQFVAAMQVLVYIGAVSISMVFAVMLARPPQEASANPRHSVLKVASGIIVALFGAYSVGRVVLAHPWHKAEVITSQGTLAEIGVNFLTKQVFVFELISLVLLVAITGSVVVARRGRGEPKGDEQ